MARKKPGQKKPEAQPVQDVSGKLLEDLLGELALAGTSDLTGELPLESFEPAPAPELLEVLSAALEPQAPAAQPVEHTEPAQETTEALAAMQSAIEQDPEPATLVSLNEPPLPVHRDEAETPECLPVPPPLPLAVAELQIVEEALPSASDYHLEPLEEAAGEEPAPDPQPAASATFSRRELVSPEAAEEAPAEQHDILSRLVAGIDTRVAATPAWDRVDTESAGEEESVEAYAAFELSGSVFAVPVGAIREIDRAGEITPVPNVPGFIRGVINLRGDVTCVLDMRSFIGLAPLEDHESGWLLVVSGGETRRSLALLVDEMSSLVRISAAKVKAPTGKVEDRVIPLLAGVVEQRDRVLGVLSVDSLLGSPDVRELWM